MSDPTTTNPSEDQSTATPAPGASKEHPTGLYVLFGAEAWERFSYYGMRALLVLYMTKHLKFERKDALVIYAFYTGLVYLTPIFGGAIADKVLGRRKAVLIGGTVMALGHLAMAFQPLLFLALGLLIVGNGFFKPNISTIVGGLYEEGDTRRDGGFTIFYMGINLGAYFSPKICGPLGEKLGWHFGFSAAAIGMSVGLLVFIWGQKFLGAVGLPPRASKVKIDEGKEPYRGEGDPLVSPDRLVGKDYVDVLIWIAGSCVLVFSIIKAWRVVGPSLIASPLALKWLVGAMLLGGVFFQLYRGSNREEIERISVIIILCLFNIFFWMGFEQAGGTMTLFADNQTNRSVGLVGVICIGVASIAAGYAVYRTTRDQVHARKFWIGLTLLFVVDGVFDLWTGYREYRLTRGYIVPASLFQAVNPLCIVAFAPTFSKMWDKLDSGRFRSSTPTKMAVGMVILGLGFIIMFFGQSLAKTGPVSPLWLLAVYVIHTVGELCLSPIGLSMVTKLAPSRVVSLAMGLWFLSSFVANLMAGLLEGILEPYHLPIYGVLIASSIGPAMLLFALTPVLKKWMHGRA